MPKQRYTTEEIIHKLREADVMIGQGRSVAEEPRGTADRPGQAAAGAGGRELEAEEGRGRAHGGQDHFEGSCRGTILSPTRCRQVVALVRSSGSPPPLPILNRCRPRRS